MVLVTLETMSDSNELTAKFMRQAITHISNATDSQKKALLIALLQYPPQLTALEQAEEIWKGLTEKEFMILCAKLQKCFDTEFWTFATRIR